MSRRKLMKRVSSTVAPNDGTKFGHMSDAELLKEMARRRAARGAGDIVSSHLRLNYLKALAKEPLWQVVFKVTRG